MHEDEHRILLVHLVIPHHCHDSEVRFVDMGEVDMGGIVVQGVQYKVLDW